MRGLSEEQSERIRRDTAQLLEGTGFRVQHEELLRLAARAGARVEEGGLVKLPGELLEELLAKAPEEYEIAGITGRRWRVGGGERHCLAIVTDPWIVDRESGQPRRPCLEDVRRHTRIAQRLDEVAAISLMDYPVTDVEGENSSLRALEEHLLEHDKHMCVLAASPERLARWLRLGRVLNGGEELAGSRLITAGVAVLSPLTLTHDNGELLQAACAHDLPVTPTVCPMAGTTAPYSRGGTLLQANAEAIFMAALTQMVRPGHPFLYIIGPSRTDMRSGEDLYYTLDKVLWKIAGAQLGKSYGLPTGAECGGTTTVRDDLQSGAEGMLFMQSAWDSGADLLSGIGSCGNAVSMSGEMMVIQAEWLRAARFMAAGIDVGAHANLERLEARGPGGHFLDDELTLELLRSDEFFASPLFDYDGGHCGTASMLERARGRVDELLADFRSPVPEEIREEIGRFFREECG